ncbi:hypothetical protein PEDI_30490 [Persicobacter diffluens]|uniref:Uncharacterized protein n=1 Tax=Persicobacter diffluens TaxID=981 RepID=A0AAN4VZU0_9BACT|nr:hypothetical protein PEDI_30490 [Persicobacter diffluens]
MIAHNISLALTHHYVLLILWDKQIDEAILTMSQIAGERFFSPLF